MSFPDSRTITGNPFEFLVQQLLVRLGPQKVMKKGQWKADKDEYSAWEDECEKARAEIALRVTPEVMHTVRASEDRALIWENIKTALGSKGWTTRLALRRQLFRTDKQSTQSMRAWTNNIRELAHKITDLGGTISGDELIVILTNNLPDSYHVSLELVEESKLTVDYVINRLVNEEDQKGYGFFVYKTL
jgi:hypothetical protein